MSAREKLEGYSMQPELRGKRAWRAVLVPDLFGPVWVWRPVY